MGNELINQAVTGSADPPQVAVADALGALTKQTQDLADEFVKADGERKVQIKAALDEITAQFGPMKAQFEQDQQAKAVSAALEQAEEMRQFLAGVRAPAKSI